MNNKTTQYDMAEILNISRSTVSLALMDSPRIRKETRERVNKLAARLNYRPSFAARNMVLGKTFSVGIISPPFSQPFHAELASQIHALLHNQNYAGIFFPVGGFKEQAEAAEFLLAREVDGIIITTDFNEDVLINLRNENARIVFYCKPLIQADYVSVDIYKAGCMAVEHLVKCGHKKIGFIGLEGKGDARFEGYKATLLKHNLLFNHKWVMPVEMHSSDNFRQGYLSMRKILSLKERPTAVFARNDAFAIGTLRAAEEMSFAVPRDIAVIGFDDIRESKFSNPPLTTILGPRETIAGELVRVMMDKIEQENSGGPYEEILIQPELIIRESCGFGNAGNRGLSENGEGR